jgi:hypothetical protein
MNEKLLKGFLLLLLCCIVGMIPYNTSQAAKKGQYLLKVNKQQNVVTVYQKNKKHIRHLCVRRDLPHRQVLSPLANSTAGIC